MYLKHSNKLIDNFYLCLAELYYWYFRCQSPAECIPLFNNDDIAGLPMSNSNDPLHVLGRCVMPCSQDCSFGAQDLQCGTDGRTYYNACFRNCANIQVNFGLIVCELPTWEWLSTI